MMNDYQLIDWREIGHALFARYTARQLANLCQCDEKVLVATFQAGTEPIFSKGSSCLDLLYDLGLTVADFRIVRKAKQDVNSHRACMREVVMALTAVPDKELPLSTIIRVVGMRGYTSMEVRRSVDVLSESEDLAARRLVKLEAPGGKRSFRLVSSGAWIPTLDDLREKSP